MDPLFALQDKTILVAGAAGGIGSALATHLATRGARLILTDLDPERVRKPDNTECVVAPMDVTDEGSIAHAVDTALQHYGQLDGVLNAAGILTIGSALDLTEEAFQATLDINLKGPFLLSRVAARAMCSDGGAIVHLASISAKMSNANYAAYASSKAGLAHLVRVLGREWADRGITVNAIGPAIIETGMTSPHLDDPDFQQRYLDQIPMGRMSTPDDLIGTVILLLSSAGRFITGQTLYVDGGRTLV